MSSIIETPVTSLLDDKHGTRAYFLHNRKLLFFFAESIIVYNISDPTVPNLIPSQLLAPLENPANFLAVASSTDEKILFMFIKDRSELTHLYTIDVSDLQRIKILSDLELPKVLHGLGEQPLIISRDMKKGFLVTDRNILVIDFKNLSSPVILGMIPLGILSDGSVSNFFLSSDEKNGYLSGHHGELIQVNLDMPYTLYLQQEKLLLGKKYSDSLLFLQSDKNDSAEFALMNPSDYKIAKLLTYDFKIWPFAPSPIVSFSSLPSWMSFDYENQVFSVESKKQNDLGSYTLYSIISKKIPLKVFSSSLPDSIVSEDIITSLISQGYMDNQRFLTSSFGSFEDFLLPSEYWAYKETIYSTLLIYRIETFTDFEVIPSLKLSTISSGKLSINTPSNSSVFVDIRLHSSNETKAEFLQKNYGILYPIITNQKSRLTIEGPLDLINQALKDLVINLNTPHSSCSGEITINDKMNFPISQAYQNISSYFFKNEAPELNTSHPFTLQQQIDQNPLYTGQAFAISIDPDTFIDHHSDTLTYELIQPSSNGKREKKLAPSWLALQNGLTLKGTPPEDFFRREVNLILIVKNEFKQMEVPLVLNIKISWSFAGKLLMKYGPYILGILGLIVNANKIYSILLKKRYRHPKNFYVRPGEGITSGIIFPIKFIAEEKSEGELILKKLILIENSDETNIKEAIKDFVVNELGPKVKEKLKLYCQGGSLGQKRVEQYIINHMIMKQLDSKEEKPTKNLFDRVKEDWVEFIEYEKDSFRINETHLETLLTQEQRKTNRHRYNNDLADTSNDSLLSERGLGINFTLLKKALVVYAAQQHEIDYLERKVDIEVKRKTERNFLWRFLKRDLEKIPHSGKSRMVYGINYRIQDDVLEISGTPDATFDGKTLVFQIISKRQQILKELWIYGTSNSMVNEKKRASYATPPQTNDKSYDVF